MKLMTIVGTRPELIRMSEIIKKADRYFEHILVHTGQNYDTNLNEIFYQDLEIRKPDYYLDVPSHSLGQTIGNVIGKSYDLMVAEKPEALLILGDTNSALCAIAAKRLKIPIFHMEAGNRCFDENLPEETNRRIVDHVADVNLPYTEHARKNLLAEGIRSEYIYVTGSPMKEVILAHQEAIKQSDILDRLSLNEKEYIIFSSHREENIDHPGHFNGLVKAINRMAETYGMPIIFSVHPRSAKRIKENNIIFHPLVREMVPFNFTDYTALMKNSYCVVSDSGTVPEEAAIQHFPAVCIRTSTERPEALDRGCFIIGGITEENIIHTIDMAVGMNRETRSGGIVRDYDYSDVSSVVLGIIQSYVPIVNERVWRKA